MKKIYLIPTVEVENLNVEECIVAGSPTVGPTIQDEDAEDPTNPDNNLAKEEEWGNIW